MLILGSEEEKQAKEFYRYWVDFFVATIFLFRLLCEMYGALRDFDTFFVFYQYSLDLDANWFEKLERAWLSGSRELHNELVIFFATNYFYGNNRNESKRYPELLTFLTNSGWPKKSIYTCIRENKNKFIYEIYSKMTERFTEKILSLGLDKKIYGISESRSGHIIYPHREIFAETIIPKLFLTELGEEKRRKEAKQKEIQTLKSQTKTPISSTQCKGDSNECGLCLEEYKPGENIVVLNWTKGSKTCGHCFHEKCLNNINNQSTTCPICRKPITHRSTFKYFNPLQRRPSVQLSTRKKIPDFELANKTYEYVPHLMKDNMIGLDSRMQSLAPKRRLKEFDEIAPWQVNPDIEDEKDYLSPNRLPRRSSIGLMDPRVLSSIKDYDTPNNPEEVFNQLKMFVKQHQRFPLPGEKVDIYDIGDFWNKGVLQGGKYARYLADKDLQLLYFGREIQALLQFVDDKKRLPRENETYKNLNIGEFLNKIEKNYQRYNHVWKVITDDRTFRDVRAKENRRM
jgi:hypothetical protein